MRKGLNIRNQNKKNHMGNKTEISINFSVSLYKAESTLKIDVFYTCEIITML